MEWRNFEQAITRLLDARGVAWRRVATGIAVEYSDGCDLELIEPRMFAPLADNPQAAAEAWFERFSRIDQARSRILIALRHHARNNKTALDRSRSGRWNWESAGGSSSSIQVGARLTRLAAQESLSDALAKLLQTSWFRVPKPNRLEKLLAHASPPDDELVYRDEDGEKREIRLNPDALAVDLSAFDDEDFAPQSSEELTAAIMPHRDAPGLEVVRRLIERIGQDRFSIDLCSKHVAEFEFSDGHASFRVRALGPRIDRQVAEHGVAGLVDKLAEEFARLDAARGQALRAVDTLMACRGFTKDAINLERRWWYGTTHKQYCFNPGTELTRRLARRSVVDALGEWFQEQGLELPSQADIEDVDATNAKAPPLRRLPAEPPDQMGGLVAFESLDLERIGNLAGELIAEFKRRAELEGRERQVGRDDPLLRWLDRNWYARGRDTWADEAWWISQAQRVWSHPRREQQDYWLPRNQAALILLANGVDAPREAILRQVSRMEYYDEEILYGGLAWLLADALPWPHDEDDDGPDYPSVLWPLPARLGRSRAMRVSEELARATSESDSPVLSTAAKIDLQTGREWLSSAEIERLHELCLCWASGQSNFHVFLAGEPLEVAATFGWDDVVDSLADNPTVAIGLLHSDLSRLHLGRFAAGLSLVKPGRYAARWAAQALLMDAQAEVETTAASIAAGEARAGTASQLVNMPSMVEAWRQSHRESLEAERMLAAIAWNRCREAGFPA